MNEWRKVIGGAYEVSRDGQMRRAKPGRRTWIGRPISPLNLKNGYLGVRPVVGGKNIQVYLHRLVAEAFLGPCPPGHEVNHIDGDKRNARAENLEYVTHSANGQHASRIGLIQRGERHHGAKLSDVQVADMRAMWERGATGVSIARAFGVSGGTVSVIVNGKRRCA